jgi:hypothetical protein
MCEAPGCGRAAAGYGERVQTVPWWGAAIFYLVVAGIIAGLFLVVRAGWRTVRRR